MNIHKKQISRLRILKWVITVVALSFLYYEIFVHHNAFALFKEYQTTIRTVYPSLIIVALLMPINWLLESLKWRGLLTKTSDISVGQSIRGVLMGVTLGLFTPNGVGEFAGRMWVVQKRFRQQAVSSSIVGSMAQLCITITVGGALIVFYASQFVAKEWIVAARILAVLTVVIGLISYYKMPEIANKFVSRFKFFNRFEKFKESITSFTKKALTKAYVFSFLRYIVFCTQLAILLFAIGGMTPAQLPMLLGLIPVYYYIQTIIPTVALSEIGVRGLILLFLFSGFLVESEVILISFLIWIINLIIPGLIGMYFLIRTRFLGK
ncbi:MAG: hypothetical protein ACI8SE_001094 [Bacteroidia bacterium]